MQHEGREKSQPGKERRGGLFSCPFCTPSLAKKLLCSQRLMIVFIAGVILLCHDLSLGNRLTGC